MRIVFMIQYKCGDIVLLAFPYSDTLNIKKRPALVILDTGDEDIISVRITTQIHNTDFDVIINNWQDSNLLAPSVIRCHKIATLDKSLVIKKLKNLIGQDLENLKRIFNNSIKAN
jgi:mRNA interferase MazF